MLLLSLTIGWASRPREGPMLKWRTRGWISLCSLTVSKPAKAPSLELTWIFEATSMMTVWNLSVLSEQWCYQVKASCLARGVTLIAFHGMRGRLWRHCVVPPLAHGYIPYSGQLSREKTFAFFAVSESAKVFSANIVGGDHLYGRTSNPRKFLPLNRESFLPRMFSAIRYYSTLADKNGRLLRGKQIALYLWNRTVLGKTLRFKTMST